MATGENSVNSILSYDYDSDFPESLPVCTRYEDGLLLEEGNGTGENQVRVGGEVKSQLCTEDKSEDYIPFFVSKSVSKHMDQKVKEKQDSPEIVHQSVEPPPQVIGTEQKVEQVKEIEDSPKAVNPDTVQKEKQAKLKIVNQARTLVDSILHCATYLHALGLVLLIHNQDVPPGVDGLESLVGIEDSTSLLRDEFEKLGLAVLWLKDPTSELIDAVMDYLTSLKREDYPLSYRFFLTYVTCHGKSKVFYTKNGSASYENVVDVLMKLPANFTSKAFIFDCCRTSAGGLDMGHYPNGDTYQPVPNHPESQMETDTMIVYSTSNYRMSWGHGGGMSDMAGEMITQLPIPNTLEDLLKEVRKKIPNQTVPGHGTLKETINLPKDRNTKMTPTVTPTVESPLQVSADGAKGTLSVSVPPAIIDKEFFYLRKLRVETKSENGWENIRIIKPNIASHSISIPLRARPRPTSSASTSRPKSESVPLLSTADSFDDCGGTMFTVPSSLQQAYTPLPTLGRVPHPAQGEQVSLSFALPVERAENKNMEFRVVAEYWGGVKVESDIETCPLGQIVKPSVTSANISFRSCHKPEATVTLNTPQSPSIDLSNITIKVYRNGSSDLVHTEDVPVVHEQHVYPLSFLIPEVADDKDEDEYFVSVVTRRVDRKEVSSDCFNATTTKGWLPCVCLFLPFLVAIALVPFFLVFVSILIVNGMNAANTILFETTVLPTLVPFVLPTPSNNTTNIYNCLLDYDYTKNRVELKQNSNLDIFCDEIDQDTLKDSHKVNQLGPGQTISQSDKVLNNTQQFLPFARDPFGVYVLKTSLVTLSVCLYNDNSTTARPPVQLLLFRYDSLSTNWIQNVSQAIGKTDILFDDSLCSNTTIVASESAVVYLSLQTPGQIHIKSIRGYVDQVRYDVQIDKERNRIPQGGQSKIIPGDSQSKLVCYVKTYSDQPHIKLDVIKGSVSLTWVTWRFILVTVVTILIFCFIVLVSVCLVCCKCVCRKCRHSRRA